MASLRALGTDYLEALAQRDFARVVAHLHPQVAFRALVPSGVREAGDATGALAWLRRWFGDADELTVLQQASDDSLGCLALSYRFLLRTQDEWQVVAQQVSAPVPHADAVLDALGEGCATLTPLIRARVRELESGQILDVRTDDPTAHESLQAWCRLTGHTLAAVEVNGAQGQRFLIRKK
jgi:TusA-related sulfurtransferase